MNLALAWAYFVLSQCLFLLSFSFSLSFFKLMTTIKLGGFNKTQVWILLKNQNVQQH